MNNQLIISMLILASISVSIIMCTDTGGVIQITNSFTDDSPYGCNRNLTLTCKFITNRTVIEWMISKDIRKIAKCSLLKNKCSLNDNYVGQYDISANVREGIFNLTIIHVTKQHSGRKLVCTDGSNSDAHVINVTGADVAILQTSSTNDGNPHACGKSLTLDCVFTRKAVSVVWMNANNLTRIAICSQKNCSLNPQYTDQYDLSFNMRRCIVSLTIRMVTKKDDGRKMICSDGPNNDFYIINVRNYAPRLYEDTNALTATSGCVSKKMNVLLKWIKINADSGIEKEINLKFRDNNTRTCSNQSMCGNDHEIQYTETIAVNPGKGNCFLKVLATYDDKPLESPATVKKYTIEDSDCINENSVNVRTQSTNVTVTVVVVVVVVVVFVIVVLSVLVVVCSLKRRAKKRSKQPCKQAGITGDTCKETGIPPTDEKQKLLSNPTIQGINLWDGCGSQEQGKEDKSEENVVSENETTVPDLTMYKICPTTRLKCVPLLALLQILSFTLFQMCQKMTKENDCRLNNIHTHSVTKIQMCQTILIRKTILILKVLQTALSQLQLHPNTMKKSSLLTTLQYMAVTVAFPLWWKIMKKEMRFQKLEFIKSNQCM